MILMIDIRYSKNMNTDTARQHTTHIINHQSKLKVPAEPHTGKEKSHPSTATGCVTQDAGLGPLNESQRH